MRKTKLMKLKESMFEQGKELVQYYSEYYYLVDKYLDKEEIYALGIKEMEKLTEKFDYETLGTLEFEAEAKDIIIQMIKDECEKVT